MSAVKIVIFAPDIHMLDKIPPSAKQALNRLILCLSRGEFNYKVQLLKVHPETRAVLEFWVMRALRVYLTLTATPSGPVVHIWGLRFVAKQGDRCLFPYGGPWFGGTYPILESRVCTSLAVLPGETEPAGMPEMPAPCLPSFEVLVTSSNEASFRAKLPGTMPAAPLVSFREALDRAASALSAGLPQPKSLDPMAVGLMPVVLAADSTAGEALAQMLRFTDAVICMGKYRRKGSPGNAPFWHEEALPSNHLDRIVVLFCSDDPAPWSPPWRPGVQAPEVRSFLLRLQKIAALARRGLVFCLPADYATLFSAPVFRGLVFTTDDPTMAAAVLSGPRDVPSWLDLGRSFLATGCPHAAVGCFIAAGDEKATNRAQARMFAIAGDAGAAADKYAAARDWDATAQQFALAGMLDKGLAAFARIRHSNGCRRMRAAMMAEEGAYLQLGLLYARAKMWLPAVHAYLRAGAYDKIAALWDGPLNDPVRALEAYRAAGCFDKAAVIVARQGRTSLAIQYYIRAGLIREAGRLVESTGPGALRKFHCKYGGEAQYLYLVESEGDLEATLEVLRRWNPGRVRLEAEAYGDHGDAFRAYARYRVLNDAAQAGTWAMKLERCEEAAVWFTRVGDHRAAAAAHSRARAYVQALRSLLADDGELPDFTRARRVLPKIRDRNALKTLVVDLFTKGAWARAAWLCERLKDYAGVAVASMGLGNQESVAKALAAMRGYHELERLGSLCLAHGLIKQGMEQVLKADPCYSEWLRGKVSETDTPSLFVLAKQYFAHHPNRRLKMRWALRLRDRDRYGLMAYAAFLAFESLPEVSQCLQVVFRWMDKADAWRGLMRAFAAELHDYGDQPAAYGLRCYFLGKTAAVDEVLAHLPMTDDNVYLFLLRDCSPAMTARYIGLSDWDCLPEEVFPDDPGLRQVADQAARGQAWKAAALCYLLAGCTEEALTCLRKRHDPLTVARLNLLLGRFPEALAGFQQVEPRPLADLARVYEALHKYMEAFACYQEQGDLKAARRCRRRLIRIGVLKPRTAG